MQSIIKEKWEKNNKILKYMYKFHHFKILFHLTVTWEPIVTEFNVKWIYLIYNLMNFLKMALHNWKMC